MASRLIRRLALLGPLLLPAGGALATCVQSVAQDRGMARSETYAPVKAGHRYVVAIGINSYANWPKLQTAVNDATGFAKLLETNFGYEAAVPPLTEKDATRDRIHALIEDSLRGKLKPEDDLVIFFAGHGTTRTDDVGGVKTEVGFLVPFEADGPAAERWSTYLDVDEFLREVSSLPARHILVILDSCHSGLALGQSFGGSRGAERYSQDMGGNVARKVIASAQGKQTASDHGPIPGHSLFTGLMMQGLMKGEVDGYHQGFFTASQLGLYVQVKVGAFEGSRQTPMFGHFYRDNDGELVLPTTPGGKIPESVAGADQPKDTTVPRGTEAPAPRSAPPSDAKAALEDLEVRLDGLSSRATAASTGVDNMRRTMQQSGMNLRLDVVEEQTSMKGNLAKAQSALQAHDAERASRFADLTEADLVKLEKFLGRR